MPWKRWCVLRRAGILLSLALARVGDTAQATRAAADLERTYLANTLLKLYWLPTIRAAVELKKNNPSQALVDLEAAAPYEQGQSGITLTISILLIYGARRILLRTTAQSPQSNIRNSSIIRALWGTM
jgi:hypothetical protein